MMDIVVHSTFLPHADPDESLAFYRDALDFEVRKDVAFGANRWITVGPKGSAGSASIVLYPPNATPGITDHEKRTIGEMMAKGTFATLLLATRNLDAAFQRLQDHGAGIVQEPADQPYGVRDLAVRDPAGNMIRIQQIA